MLIGGECVISLFILIINFMCKMILYYDIIKNIINFVS